MNSFALSLAIIAGAAQATTWGAPQYQHGHYSAPQQQHWGQPSWGGHHGHQEHAHNPWDNASQNHHDPWYYQPKEKPEGWYSYDQQYTDPKIPYVPEQKTVYAVCEFGRADSIELA